MGRETTFVAPPLEFVVDPNASSSVETPQIEHEPLCQEVIRTITKSENGGPYTVFEGLLTPPLIAYTREEKADIEKHAEHYYPHYLEFERNGAMEVTGRTRSLGAGQIAQTEDEKILFIGKTPDYDAETICGLDIPAGASLQKDNIDYMHTAAREGNSEELVEIKDGAIVAPPGQTDHVLHTARKNIALFYELYDGELPDSIRRVFDTLLSSSENTGAVIEKPYAIHPKLIKYFQAIPSANVHVVRNREITHSAHGLLAIHPRGGDLLQARIVNPRQIIDLEVVTNPDRSRMPLNRKFVAATPEEAVRIQNGEEVEITIYHMGREWKQPIQTEFKPLANEFVRRITL